MGRGARVRPGVWSARVGNPPKVEAAWCRALSMGKVCRAMWRRPGQSVGWQGQEGLDGLPDRLVVLFWESAGADDDAFSG